MFVDANILVYAHDATAGAKRDRERLLGLDLWESGKGCLSIQVLQELFVVVTRKVPSHSRSPSPPASCPTWRDGGCMPPQPLDLLVRLHRSADLPFWDAMIVRSAIALGAPSF